MKIAIIADIHGNLPALRVILKDIMKERVKTTICLGDLVGYNPFPNESISEIIRHNINSVLGNHDNILLENGKITESFSANSALQYHKKIISERNKNYLRQLKKKIDFSIASYKIEAFHGSPRNFINGRIYYFNDNLLKGSQHKILFAGNTHIPLSFKLKDNHFINPGSVGQPRDGDPRASYVLLDLDSNEICLKKLFYDMGKINQKMKKLNFNERIANCLFVGEWIGEDLNNLSREETTFFRRIKKQRQFIVNIFSKSIIFQEAGSNFPIIILYKSKGKYFLRTSPVYLNSRINLNSISFKNIIRTKNLIRFNLIISPDFLKNSQKLFNLISKLNNQWRQLHQYLLKRRKTSLFNLN